MTNEEIQHDEKLENLYHQVSTIVLRRDAHSTEAIALLAHALREAKAEAYEEAVWVVEGVEEGYTSGDAYGACTEIATSIRSMKDSLVAETISS